MARVECRTSSAKNCLTVAPNAVTLLLLVDQGVADLLAFFRKRHSLTILGDHAGSGPNDFPRFLAGGLIFVGVNALPRNRIPIGVAGNGVVLAVVVGSELTFDRLPFRIRPFDSDLDALSDGFLCQCLALQRRARAEHRFCSMRSGNSPRRSIPQAIGDFSDSTKASLTW